MYTCESICVLTFIFLNIYSMRTNSHINASLGSMLCPNCIKVWSTEELTNDQMHRFCSLQGQWVQQSCFRATCWDFSLEQDIPTETRWWGQEPRNGKHGNLWIRQGLNWRDLTTAKEVWRKETIRWRKGTNKDREGDRNKIEAESPHNHTIKKDEFKEKNCLLFIIAH